MQGSRLLCIQHDTAGDNQETQKVIFLYQAMQPSNERKEKWLTII